MPYVTHLFKPKTYGEYWRRVLSSYDKCEPYSAEVEPSIFAAHPRDSDGNLVLPHGRCSRWKGDYSEYKGKIEMAIQVYHDHDKQLTKAYQQAKKLFAIREVKPFYRRDFSPNDHRLLRVCHGLRERGLRDSRTLNQRVKDYWFLAGYSSLTEDYEKIFLCCLLSQIDYRGMAPLFQGHGSYIDSLDGGPMKWTIKHCDRLCEEDHNGPFRDVYMGLKSALYTLAPIGELELFRRLAKKVWDKGPNECSLDPAEYLYLKTHIASSRIGLICDSEKGTQWVPGQIREQRSPLGPMDGIVGYTTTSTREVTNVCRNLFIDFWDELNYFNQYESYKGSSQCHECGTFIPLSFDAYGQKYCSPQCKKRVNKRSSQQKHKLKGRQVE